MTRTLQKLVDCYFKENDDAGCWDDTSGTKYREKRDDGPDKAYRRSQVQDRYKRLAAKTGLTIQILGSFVGEDWKPGEEMKARIAQARQGWVQHHGNVTSSSLPTKATSSRQKATGQVARTHHQERKIENPNDELLDHIKS